MNLEIRNSRESDRTEIENLHMEAFGPQEGPEIRQLVNDMFSDETARPLLSLVAVDAGRVLGHVIFTRAEIIGANGPVSARILAPLAVLPGVQSQGVGSRLVREGLDRLREAGVGLVFVLGHPAYYRRFGFVPAGIRGLEATYPIPEKHAEAWMVQELRPGVIGETSGRVRCAEALDKPGYWIE